MEAENLLREFGLTEYEIKAYMSLLKLGIATADQISNMGNIPLPRVYDTLVELQKKGFVLISKGRPKKFKPIDPKKSLKSLIDLKKKNFENDIKSLESSAKNIENELTSIEKIRKPKEDVLNVWSIEKRSNVIKALNEQLSSAKKEVLAFAGDMSWLPEVLPSIKSVMKKNVQIKILAKPVSKNDIFVKNVRRVKKMGIKIKTGYEGVLRGYVIDEKTVSIALKISSEGVNIADDGFPKSDVNRKYETVIIQNSTIAKALKENFKFWWKKLA